MMATTELETKSAEGTSLVHVFLARARATGTAPAARWKEGGAWKEISWSDLEARARRLSNALLSFGVQKGDRVCLMGDTRLEWVVCDLAIQAVGAATVPIYQSNLPDECQYVADNCGAKLVLVDSEKQAAKFVKVRAQLPQVQQVVQYLGEVRDAAGGYVRPVESLYGEGDDFAKASPAALDERARTVTKDDLSTIIYTSGTTGKPKGVMLTHDSFVFEAESVEAIGLVRATDVELMFLPLAHVFAQVLKAIWFRLGHVMVFAESLEKLIDNMGETHPTFMAAVPRVFEKAYNKVVTDGAHAPGLKGKLFRMTMAEFDKYAIARDENRSYDSLALKIGRKLVLPKIKERLDARFGGNLRFFVSGGAPLARKIGYFFELVGIDILEGFGLTETSAATCVNRQHHNKIGTVGPPLPGMELKIAPDGELLIRGRGVMKGYFQNPEATKEVMLADGWFATGDIGEIDTDGHLRITDRKKDIIVTAGGKNVAPQNLENALKTSPILSQVVIHGDQRKFLTALVTINEERARKVAEEQGFTFTDYADLTRKPEIRAEVQAAFDALNAQLPSYESVKKFTILSHDFSQESGELTPTLKVKRKLCNAKYKAEFDAMYAGAE
jgi:long-chain acyl-CoA synthetase